MSGKSLVINDDSSENYGTPGFEYVVDKSVRSPIAFGSKLEREVMPRKGPNLNSFMRYTGFEESPSHKLMTYIAWPISKPKMATFSKGQRWSTTNFYQPPQRPMSPPPPRMKRPYIPFNSKIYERGEKIKSITPGPGFYNPIHKKTATRFHHSFGGIKTIVPAVDIKCVPINYDTCARCHIKCGEQGDYWQHEDKTFLCRACFEKLYKKLANRAILHTYEPIRDCSFAHYHERSKNAIKLIGIPEIKKKILREAYLGRFFSNVQNLKYTPGINVEK